MDAIRKVFSFQPQVISEEQLQKTTAQNVNLGVGGTADQFQNPQNPGVILAESNSLPSKDLQLPCPELTIEPSKIFENLAEYSSTGAKAKIKTDHSIANNTPSSVAGKEEVIPTKESEAITRMQKEFKTQFEALAKDPEKFHAALRNIYGKWESDIWPGDSSQVPASYSTEKAEALRQKALAGDYSWLPQVKFVPEKSVLYKNGAFSDGPPATVYLNEQLLNKDPDEATRAYIRGVGRQLDNLTNNPNYNSNIVDEAAMNLVVDQRESYAYPAAGRIANKMKGLTAEEDERQKLVSQSLGEQVREAKGDEGELFRAMLADEPPRRDPYPGGYGSPVDRWLDISLDGRPVQRYEEL